MVFGFFVGADWEEEATAFRLGAILDYRNVRCPRYVEVGEVAGRSRLSGGGCKERKEKVRKKRGTARPCLIFNLPLNTVGRMHPAMQTEQVWFEEGGVGWTGC